ncbi:MAG: adenylosuccinate synthase [Acidobacteria bacterium]|nr:adenylosuccinate synthase [Acidobacteriota bacterium]
MSNTVLTGMQWGDEGKGKIIDLLSPAFDAVVRYQGGNNAGHTVKFSDRHFALHLIPSGILTPGMHCVLGNGMVIPPDAFFEELESLRASGVETEERLWISDRAHVLLPIYAEVDKARELQLGTGRIGTTARGIGPAYEAKIARQGVRMCDLYSERLEGLLMNVSSRLRPELGSLGRGSDVASLLIRCRDWAERLKPFVADTGRLINEWIDAGSSVLFEGAQGVLLDVDHGTYPFVTSSNATAGGASTGSGVAPTRIDGSIGVLKAYTTRVGSGPFPTELAEGEPDGDFLRRRGNEFGTTTGRPRRCGWLDLVIARYARRVNDTEIFALTKIDVLDRFESIKVCVAYRIDGEEVRDFPSDLGRLERAEPVYEELPGWNQETAGTTRFEDLPENARDYVAYLEDDLEASAAVISTGPRREETIVLDQARLEQLTRGRLQTPPP